jgi:hypothetical protein
LERLRETLERIDKATEPTKGTRDVNAETWILFAADAWVDYTGQLPTDSARGPFLTALERHQRRDLPVVTRAVLRDVLPRWHKFRTTGG